MATITEFVTESLLLRTSIIIRNIIPDAEVIIFGIHKSKFTASGICRSLLLWACLCL